MRNRVRLTVMFVVRPAIVVILFLTSVVGGCRQGALNNPYPSAEQGANVLYSSFKERPKHLDPVQSYFENEIRFTAQIYMPPLQYHYLKRPYQLIPFAASAMPKVIYYDRDGKVLAPQAQASEVARTR